MGVSFGPWFITATATNKDRTIWIEIILTEVWRPTLNVRGTILWAEVLGCIKRRKLPKEKHPLLFPDCRCSEQLSQAPAVMVSLL